MERHTLFIDWKAIFLMTILFYWSTHFKKSQSKSKQTFLREMNKLNQKLYGNKGTRTVQKNVRKEQSWKAHTNWFSEYSQCGITWLIREETHKQKLPTIGCRKTWTWIDELLKAKSRRGVLKARILKWFAIPFCSGPCFVRTLHHDLSILGGPTQHDS